MFSTSVAAPASSAVQPLLATAPAPSSGVPAGRVRRGGGGRGAPGVGLDLMRSSSARRRGGGSRRPRRVCRHPARDERGAPALAGGFPGGSAGGEHLSDRCERGGDALSCRRVADRDLLLRPVAVALDEHLLQVLRGAGVLRQLG